MYKKYIFTLTHHWVHTADIR